MGGSSEEETKLSGKSHPGSLWITFSPEAWYVEWGGERPHSLASHERTVTVARASKGQEKTFAVWEGDECFCGFCSSWCHVGFPLAVTL